MYRYIRPCGYQTKANQMVVDVNFFVVHITLIMTKRNKIENNIILAICSNPNTKPKHIHMYTHNCAYVQGMYHCACKVKAEEMICELIHIGSGIQNRRFDVTKRNRISKNFCFGT